MVSFIEGVRESLRTIQCPLLSANEYIVGSVGRFAGPLRERAFDGINATRRLLGCPESNDPEPPPPPFTGGQCDFAYIVQYQIRNDQDQLIGNFSREVWGPVGGVTFSGNEVFILCHGLTPAARLSTQQPILVSTVPGGDGLTATLTGISVSGGGPDNCGDPPPIFPPPTNFNINVDVTYNIDDGTEVTVTVPFVFAPVSVNFDGSLSLPFTINFGGFNFTGNLNLNPDFNLTINPPAIGRGEGQGLEELPAGDPAEEVEPLPFDEKIIGVAVTSSIVGEQQFTTIATQGMPNILAPRAGSIKFAYSLAATTFWSNDIDVKGDRIFIPCPFSQGADAVVVSPAPGVALQWVPISGPPLATVADLG